MKWIVSLILSLCFFGLGIYKKIQNERFIRQGKKYRGIIIKKRREIAYKHSRYFATVRFDADGVSYEKEVRYIPLIGQENAEDMMLIYPPGQPDKVMSESFLKWERTMVHMFAFGAVFMVYAVYMLVSGKSI
ncbi:MAG: hypothetical protein J6D00_06095 [Christensenellaceae bacterium]|nr:hypothetical protein [Christensenellaceae bacterium]